MPEGCALLLRHYVPFNITTLFCEINLVLNVKNVLRLNDQAKTCILRLSQQI